MTRLPESRNQRIAAVGAGLVLLYALVGFAIAPPIARRVLIDVIAEETGHRVELEDLRLNPFTLAARAEGFTVYADDGQPITGFERLYVNLQLESIWRNRVVLARVSLRGPRVRAALYEDGRLNLAALLPESEPEVDAGREADAEPLFVDVEHAVVENGRVEFYDLSQPRSFRVALTPITFEVRNFSTSGQHPGHFSFSSESDNGEVLTVSGNFGLSPIFFEGNFGLDDIRMRTLWEYLRDERLAASPEGRIDLSAGIRLSPGVADAGLIAELRHGEISIQDFAFTLPDRNERIARVPRLDIGSVDISLGEQTLRVGAIRSRGAHVSGWLEEDGRTIFDHILDPDPQLGAAREPTSQAGESVDPALEPDAAPPEPSRPWHVHVAQIDLLAWQIEQRGLSDDPPARLHLSDLDVRARGLDTRPNQPFELAFDATLAASDPAEPLANPAGALGTLGADGEAQVDPPRFEGQLYGTALALGLAQPYLSRAAHVALAGGTLDFEAKAALSLGAAEGETPPPTLRLEGGLGVRGLDVRVPEPGPVGLFDDAGRAGLARASRLLTLRALDLRGIDLRVEDPTAGRGGGGLGIQEVRVEGAQGTVELLPDGSNVARITPGSSEDRPAADPSPSTFEIRMDRIEIVDSAASLDDRTVKPPFELTLDRISGSLEGLSTSGGRSRADLTARLQKAAEITLRAEGSTGGAHPEGVVDVDMTGFGLPPVSPYSEGVTGWGIERGKLSVDLRYAVRNGKLKGSTGLLVDRFELGAKTRRKDVSVLPMPLAVALLKDRDERIELDLRVNGDLDDPSFSVVGLIAKTLTLAITKAVASPFDVIAGLAGGEGKDLQSIHFVHGEVAFDAEQRAKLAKIAQVLDQRPRLDLEIVGVAELGGDRDALARKGLWSELSEGDAGAEAREAALREGHYAERIERAYRERYGGAPMAADLLEYMPTLPLVASGGAEVPTEGLELARAAEQRLVSDAEVADQALEALARDRARAIQAALQGEFGVEAGRVFLPMVRLAPGGDSAGETLILLELTAR